MSTNDFPDYEYILNQIKQSYDQKIHETNDDWYHNVLHPIIDDYINKNKYDAEYHVEQYGLLKAIKFYHNRYNFDTIANLDDDNIYTTLYYYIIESHIKSNYHEELKNMSIKKKVITLQEENDILKKKIEELENIIKNTNLTTNSDNTKPNNTKPKNLIDTPYKCQCGIIINSSEPFRIKKHQITKHCKEYFKKLQDDK